MISKLQEVYSYIFTKQNLFVAVSCENSSLYSYKLEIQKYMILFLDKSVNKQNYQFYFRVQKRIN